MIEETNTKLKAEISFVWRDKDGNIKEQGTEITEITKKKEVIEDGNTNK